MSAPDELPRPWPFMENAQGEPDMEPQDDSDYCECDLTPTMSESDMNKCASCGKPLS